MICHFFPNFILLPAIQILPEISGYFFQNCGQYFVIFFSKKNSELGKILKLANEQQSAIKPKIYLK